MLKKLFGPKSFYIKVMTITIPIMLQQVLITIVGLADNIMVGQLDQDVISGVYIASKILFVVNFLIFGATEGASIFFAQFIGSNDKKHVKQCFNFKIYAETICCVIGMFILYFGGKPLALLFENETRAEIAANYLKIYTICLPFFSIFYAIASSFRESNNAIIPMVSSIIGLISNVALNFVFIFGLGLGANGAAIATVIARFMEMLFVLIMMFIKKPIFANNIFKNFKIDLVLLKRMIIKSFPLLINEILWSTGQTILIYAYSKSGDLASASLSISQALIDVFFIAAVALGNGIAIIMGNTLGNNEIDEAKRQVWYFTTLTIIVSVTMSCLLLAFSPLFANFYNVSDEVKNIAITLCYFGALLIPILSLNNSNFFMMRSGGFTAVVLIFDSVFTYVIQVPLALFLAFKSNLSLPMMYLCVNGSELIKAVIGYVLLKSGLWLRNLTNLEE